MHIPTKLAAFSEQANAQAWLRRLPTLVGELALKWDLEVGEAYANCGVAYVAPVTQQGVPLVLKVQWPHEECRYEAHALKVWDGNGAVRLIATDTQRSAMLLERCTPGESLAQANLDDAIGVLIDLLPHLWTSGQEPFKPLSQEARGWQATLQALPKINGPGATNGLIEAATRIISELADSQGPQVLLHQDLHGDNVLSSTRSAWLVIDPKPLVGEREFALSPILRSSEFGTTKAGLLYRLDRLTEAFSLDRKRACGWAIAQGIAWNPRPDQAAQQHQFARWLLAAS